MTILLIGTSIPKSRLEAQQIKDIQHPTHITVTYSIAAIIYINSIILVILAVSVFVLGGYHDVHAALFGLALLVDASLFLGVLFVPKV